ncbi:MAG: sugar phosphate isomerase/epimerase family protein [bacterium]|nr:sugar phosphate isomerase/epimerase family protein [bacterium]
MKLGFNMLLFGATVTEQQFPVLAGIKKAGYDGVEIPLLVEQTGADYVRLRGELDRLDLARTTVAIATADADPCSPDKGVRDKALEHLKWAIATSVKVGSTVLCGPLHSALGVFPSASPTPEECADRLRWSADTLREAAEMASPYLTLAVEPLNRFECWLVNTCDQAAALVILVGHDGLRMMYDTFHANIEERDPVAALEKVASLVVHFHASENDRGIPGQGHVGFANTFRALRRAGYQGFVTIEAFGQALPDLAAATRIWRPLFDDPKDVYERGIAFIKAGLASV